MSGLLLYRGCSISTGYIGNPLLIRNFQAKESLVGVFYSLARNSSFNEEARATAEGWARFHAKRLNQEPLVVVLEVNQENFPVLSGRIGVAWWVFGKKREIPILSLNQLANIPFRVRLPIITIKAENMINEELGALNMNLGKVNPEGVFIYQDFISSRANLEGNHRPLPERI